MSVPFGFFSVGFVASGNAEDALLCVSLVEYNFLLHGNSCWCRITLDRKFKYCDLNLTLLKHEVCTLIYYVKNQNRKLKLNKKCQLDIQVRNG